MSNNSSLIDHSSSLDYILLLRLIVWGYIGMVLSLFGIVGNIITVLVLISPSMRTTSTNIYLTALSCSNILFLLIFIPSYSLRYLIGYELYKTNQPPFAFEILLTRLPTSPIYNTILLSIIYLTIAVSMDRLILVQFPLKARQILTQRATLITIILIYAFSIVYCIPYWLEQRYVPDLKTCVLTSIGQRIHKYTRIYIYIPVVYLIPFATLTCINVTIIQNLIAKKRRKKHLCGKANKKKQADYHITLMLVTVVIVFVLCQLPLLILNAWYAIDPHGSYHNFLFQSLNIIGILLIVFNTSTNFLLYCFFGQKFRQTLIEFMLRMLPKQRKPANMQTRISKIVNNQPLQSVEKNQTEKQQRISTRDSFTKRTPLKIDQTKTNELSQETVNNMLDQKLENDKSKSTSMQTTINHQEESDRLITKSEQVLIMNENFPSKPDQQFKLYTGTNGKRILVLKI
ncbi:unnamed protein product [Rotaria socialis]|uniref:G-protein coupled receptors family 1 profile domain-containing protein n=1 Tax=Rotaria socialis TaxID=392032 RepID=A0A818IQ61_9BILA|nr:unnamed protein product [Rotaria socialis]CAF3528112.1 unnamed protein product [Rotaria socialis]CAF4482414.1 unnamed protein product [Rotaria socialis]CAF4809815.1 unnamed protein product [Rotaria socialis]